MTNRSSNDLFIAFVIHAIQRNSSTMIPKVKQKPRFTWWKILRRVEHNKKRVRRSGDTKTRYLLIYGHNSPVGVNPFKLLFQRTAWCSSENA